MEAPVESILCTRCGLCCNGTLFEDVELSRSEAFRLELAGLNVENEEEALLNQPCGALRGRRCSIYTQRPKCCRTFECLLLQRTKRGEITVAGALKCIEKAKASGSSASVKQLLLGSRFVSA